MSKRYQGGILGAGFNPLQAPDAPTSVTAAAGDASAAVSFTAPSNVGGSAITGYTVGSNPGGIGATGSASPITVSGLTNGTAYTFNVWALNSYGPSPAGGPSGSVTPALQRGLFGGGSTGSNSNVIDYINIASAANAIDFGDLTVARSNVGACASTTRGVFGGGNTSGNTIDYVTIATVGNAIDFGDLLSSTRWPMSCSSATRGVFGGGYIAAATSAIQYITIASTGNAIVLVT